MTVRKVTLLLVLTIVIIQMIRSIDKWDENIEINIGKIDLSG